MISRIPINDTLQNEVEAGIQELKIEENKDPANTSNLKPSIMSEKHDKSKDSQSKS